MRLEPDLIRGLLLHTEGHDAQDLSAWTDEQRAYHAAMLIEGGLLRGAARMNRVGVYSAVHVIDLTWEGHEFLANARNERLWPQVKEQVTKAGGSLSLQVIGQLLTSLATKSLGI